MRLKPIAGLLCTLLFQSSLLKGQAGYDVTTIPVTFKPNALKVADLNADGNTDLVIMPVASDTFFAVYPGLGNEQVGLPVLNRKEVNFNPFDLADLNKDGIQDAVIASYWNNGFRIFTGNGGFKFSPGPHYNMGAHATDVTFADIDKDGFQDVLGITSGSGTPVTLQVFKGDQEGNLHFSGSYPTLLSSKISTYIADKNGDGLPDVIVSTLEWLALFYQQTDGSFLLKYFPIYVASVVIGDVNKDANPDMILGYSSFGGDYQGDSILIRYGGKDTLFSMTPVKILVPGLNPGHMSIADLDNDNNPELLIVRLNNDGNRTNRLYVFTGLENSGVHLKRILTLPGTIQNFTVADLGSDGYPEIIAVSPESLMILHNKGQILSGDYPAWSTHTAEDRRAINLSEPAPDWLPDIRYNIHLPMASKKLSVLKDSFYRDIKRPQGFRHDPEEKESDDIIPEVVLNFDGGESYAVPNDDHIAVSVDGKIVAVQNNLISVFDEAGNLLARKSLRMLSGSSSMLRNFDPRIIYDESADRFILVFLTGNTYETNKVGIAFSGSSDPAGEWYYYTFSGNPFNDSTWLDYPGIAINGPWLYLTFNAFRNSSVNNSGFRQSLIWQLEKQKGYDNVPARELTANILQNIRYNGNLLFAIHPVTGSPDTCMYFLSTNALSTVPDNNFRLLKLSTKKARPSPEIRSLTSSLPYQLPPDALQKNTDRKLNTNDARIQDSYYSDKSIRFVMNSARPFSGGLGAGIYFGTLPDVSGDHIDGDFLPDTLETAFASIAPVQDKGVLLCYAYSSAFCFPGVAVIYRDNQGHYSRPVNVIEGSDWVAFWGDYNKICRHPSDPDAYWLSACYGLEDGTISNGELATRIARIIMPLSTGNYDPMSMEKELILFPNPSPNKRMTASFSLTQSQSLDISIYSLTGKLVGNILNGQMPSGTHRVSFSTAPLSPGVYLLVIKGQQGELLTERFIAE